ncbi:YdaU family protein [Dyella mobilis]|uniref:YdaU family protein n=1 Tax=Dyella mobilis TaxID=1849582 RepID=A0ABS2KL06_9GAMM|nr:YdaU family protein [Dyella mobilis]MBM7131578.1 YdaU family protein [Dyella mobilis]GLQ96449.1 hypothetical protein GCM10007863_08670 [Dyella mobilis]
MNYFEFYPGDYLRDTTRLTLIDHGAYLRLLIAYYSEETALPADLNELYVMCSAVSAADKAAVKKVAERFFPISDDGLRHKNRVDEEIAKAQKRIKIAQENGSKGGRKPNPAGNPSGNPTGSSGETQRGAQRPTQSGEALHTPHAIEAKSESEMGAPEGVDPQRWKLFVDQLASDGKLSISRVTTARMHLATLIAQGHDPNEILEASVMRGLRDLKALAAQLVTERGNATNGATHAAHQSGRSNGHKPSASERVQQAIADRQAREHGAGSIIEGTFTAVDP